MMLCARVLFLTDGDGGVIDSNNALASLHRRRCITGISVCTYSKAALYMSNELSRSDELAWVKVLYLDRCKKTLYPSCTEYCLVQWR
jgi:hypothetical protein